LRIKENELLSKDNVRFGVTDNKSIVFINPGDFLVQWEVLSWQIRNINSFKVFFVGGSYNNLIFFSIRLNLIYFFRIIEVSDPELEVALGVFSNKNWLLLWNTNTLFVSYLIKKLSPEVSVLSLISKIH